MNEWSCPYCGEDHELEVYGSELNELHLHCRQCDGEWVEVWAIERIIKIKPGRGEEDDG